MSGVPRAAPQTIDSAGLTALPAVGTRLEVTSRRTRPAWPVPGPLPRKETVSMADESAPKDLSISVTELHSAITALSEKLDKIGRPQCAECSCGPCYTTLCQPCAAPCIAPCAAPCAHPPCIVSFCAPCHQHWHGTQLCAPCAQCQTQCVLCQTQCVQCATYQCARCANCTPCTTPCTPCTPCAQCVQCAQCQ
jgi:hypothetical protein